MLDSSYQQISTRLGQTLGQYQNDLYSKRYWEGRKSQGGSMVAEGARGWRDFKRETNPIGVDFFLSEFIYCNETFIDIYCDAMNAFCDEW